jgi:alpha-D-ribose 1-methylphosphonate 5-triphosphate synthase subunit PhnL
MSSSGSDEAMVTLDGVAKTFVMHLRGGARLPVLRDVTFSAGAGECVVLDGPSGAANRRSSR